MTSTTPPPAPRTRASSVGPSQVSDTVALTIDSSILTGPLRDLATATTTLGNQATQISRQLDLVDRGILEGLEKLAVKNEDTNITLSRLLASTEDLLNRSNAHILQAGQAINQGVTHFNQASQRDAAFQAAQTTSGDIARENREELLVNVQEIGGRVEEVARSHLSADVTSGYNWLRLKLGGLFTKIYETGLPVWVSFVLFSFMVWLKYTELRDRTSEATTLPIKTILTSSPSLKDVLQDPRQFLESILNAKK